MAALVQTVNVSVQKAATKEVTARHVSSPLVLSFVLLFVLAFPDQKSHYFFVSSAVFVYSSLTLPLSCFSYNSCIWL